MTRAASISPEDEELVDLQDNYVTDPDFDSGKAITRSPLPLFLKLYHNLKKIGAVSVANLNFRQQAKNLLCGQPKAKHHQARQTVSMAPRGLTGIRQF